MAEDENITPEQLEEYQEMEEDMQDDQREDMSDDQQDSQLEFQEGYGDWPVEEKHNTHSFLNKAAFVSPETLRVTNLSPEELGMPVFNVRFLLDMEDISEFYLADLCEKQDIPNKIGDYFRQKIKNITDSGMSKEGFTMMMNTTRNINMARTKKKERIDNLKGGQKNKR